MSKRKMPPRGAGFASELRFMRALELYNHETAATVLSDVHVATKVKVFPAAQGFGCGCMPGPENGFSTKDAASLHLWINDKLRCAEFKSMCRNVPGTFVSTYGAKPWTCGVCSTPIPLADLGGRSRSGHKILDAKYWMKPSGKKWCKECVVGELRSMLGDDDSIIKHRFQTLVGAKSCRKTGLLMEAGVNGFVTFGYESAETDDEVVKEEINCAKKPRTLD